MLKISNLAKSYDQNSYALKGLSFELQKGNILALLGHNGAGKSTTLRLIAGMIGATSGEVFINDTNIANAKPDILRNIKQKIGFISETTNLLDFLTAWEYLFYIGKMYGIEDDKLLEQKAQKLVNDFKISDAKDKLIKEFSSGLKKRIALASILINSPSLLLLDEPTVYLDPIGVKLFKSYLSELRDNGTAIIIATHQLDIAEKLADQILMINEGEKVFEGSLEQLKHSFDDSQDHDTLETYYAKLIKN